MRNLIIAGLLLLSQSLVSRDFRNEIYLAYITGDMAQWKTIMDRMETESERTGDPFLLYRTTEAQYGYIAYCISAGKKGAAKEYLQKAEKNIKKLLAYNEEWANVHALQGALYGFRVSLEPFKAPFYGKKSTESNERSLILSRDDPQGWMEKANIEYYKPAIFGGSKEQAVPYYEKAVGLYELEPALTDHNWMYLNCLAALANAYAGTGKYHEADRLYRRILKIEPAFKWIRDEVYPEFKLKHPGI